MQSRCSGWNGDLGEFWVIHRERHVAGHQHLIRHLFGAAGISPGERVLDVGCGCGETTIAAARAADSACSGPRGLAVGLDISRPMLEVAHQLARHAGTPIVGFVQGDAQFCPLRRESYDVVISSFGVMFFEDPSAAFTSIAGAVRPGGRLAFLCWQDDVANEWTAIPVRAFSPNTPPPTSPESDQFYDPQRITELLSTTGWESIQIDAVSERAWVGDDVFDVMNYVRGIPAISRRAAALGKPLAEQAFANIAQQYAERQQPDGVWVRAAAWLVTAQRTDGDH